MKIRNQQELDAWVNQGRVNANVAKQLIGHFESSNTSSSSLRASQVVTPPKQTSRHEKKYVGSEAELALRRSRAEYYTLPEFDTKADPAVLLYRACVRRWGRAYEGGLVVYELGIDVPTAITGTNKSKRWYADVAIPKHRICIEFDGYAHHTGLDAFKSDHLKTEHLHRLGWYVFRVGTQRVKNDVETFLDSVDSLMTAVGTGEWRSHVFPGTARSRSFKSLLLEWKLERPPSADCNTYLHERMEKYG